MNIGHNNPPTDVEIIEDYLKNSHAELLDEVSDIGAAVEFLPTEVTNDAQEITIQDFIKGVNDANKKMEKAREDNKKPYLEAGRVVDSFFKTRQTSLDSIVSILKKPLLTYKQAKAAEEARIAKIEADRLQEIADAKALEATVQEALGDTNATETLNDAIKIEAQAEKVAAFVSKVSSKSAVSSSGIKKRIVGELESREALDIIKLKSFFTDDAIQKAINAFVADGGTECKGVKIYEKQEVVVR